MKLNDEIIETYNVTVSDIELGYLPSIGIVRLRLMKLLVVNYQALKQKLGSLMQKYKTLFLVN